MPSSKDQPLTPLVDTQIAQASDLATRGRRDLMALRDPGVTIGKHGKVIPEAEYNAAMQWQQGFNCETGVAGFYRPNFVKAVEWYTKAAERGHAPAQRDLAWLYKEGKGVPQNFTKAAHWFSQAAAQGNSECQYQLALMYDEGEGVPRDLVIALEWFERAAERGHPDAKERIGWTINGDPVSRGT